MAAPIQHWIATPSEAGNLGKRQRIITRHDPYNDIPSDQVVILTTARKLQGMYHLGGAAVAALVETAHNGTSTGFWWFQNPLASTVNARIRRMEFSWTCTTELDLLGVPRVIVQRFTWSSGVASGAAIVPCKGKTTHDTNVANWRTAPTGMSGIALVSGAIAYQVIPPTLGVTGAVGMFWGRSPWVHEYFPTTEDGFLDIAPGEGLVVFQVDTGVASDGRTLSFNPRWDEYDRT